jgi:ABC-2 type transport system permease protein
MNRMRLKAVAHKELLHVVRDLRSLLLAVAIPMLMLVLFGFALTLDVDRVPLVVWDQSGSQSSREFVSRFAGSRYFQFRGLIRDYAALERAIDTREAFVALVIPYDFATRVESGRDVNVQAIVDASDSNTATLAIGYATSVTQRFSAQIAVDVAERTTGMTIYQPLDIRPRVWYNDDLSSRNYIIPGLIAVIMMVIAALLTSLTVAREWERGTMEQLVSTPIKGHELILGKLLPYFAIGMFDVVIAVLMGKFVFDVPLRGSVVLLFFMAAVFLVGALSMGIFISVITKTQLIASQMAMVLTFLPAFLLSGFAYPIGNMPVAVRIVTYLIPARYFVALLKGIYLKGVGLETLWLEAGLLVAFSATMVAAANMSFRKRID